MTFDATALARLGQPAGFTIRCWDITNALVGDISADQPLAVDSYDSTDGAALAISRSDDRLYATGAQYAGDLTGSRYLQVFTLSTGVLRTRVNLTDRDATLSHSYSAVVPAPGRVWVGIDRSTDTQIWEFDVNGVFQRIIATILLTGGLSTTLRSFATLNGILYLAVDSSGSAIARWNISTNSEMTPLAIATAIIVALGRTIDDHLAVAVFNSGSGNYEIRTYATDGTLTATWVSDGFLTGCATTSTGLAWTSDNAVFPNVLNAIATATGTLTATITDDPTIGSANIMGLAASLLNAPAPPTHETYVNEDVRWLRRTPHLLDEKKRIMITRVELDLQVGVGTVEGQGVAPIVMWRSSKDGGETWSPLRPMSMGALGDYDTRAFLTQLGQGRDWVFEASGSEPVDTALVALYATFRPGTS